MPDGHTLQVRGGADDRTEATDTPKRKPAAPRKSRLSLPFGSSTLNGIAEIRTFFRTNEQPIYFVGPTAFNLLGIDRWVRNFQYIVYYDSWDGGHPRVFTPKSKPYVEFESSEHVNNYLLRDPEVQAHLKRRGGTPMVAMVFFDEETEEICKELGYNLILPPDSLRRKLDSKIVTTQLGNEAGAPSVPNVLGTADSYEELSALADRAPAGLGPGGADALRRLRQDHLLHQVRRRLDEPTSATSSVKSSR